MCLITIITYTSCGCRITSPTDCPSFEQKIQEAEERYSKRHPLRSHDKDGTSRAPPLSHQECPLYYEEKEKVDGTCVFCSPRAKNGVRLTKNLDEMEMRMEVKTAALRRTKSR